MTKQKTLFKNNKVGLVLAALLLLTLTGSTALAGGLNVGVNITPIVVAPVVATPDNYVYYPTYGVYYNSSRHQYAYLKNQAWVQQPTPQGVSVETLRASPSVKMDFHDAPAKHHGDIMKKYPKNWAPPAAHHDQK
jgi:hypothetical protein